MCQWEHLCADQGNLQLHLWKGVGTMLGGQYLTALCRFAGLLGDAASPGGGQGAAHDTDLNKPQHCGSAALSPLTVCGMELGEISLCWIQIIG